MPPASYPENAEDAGLGVLANFECRQVENGTPFSIDMAQNNASIALGSSDFSVFPASILKSSLRV